MEEVSEQIVKNFKFFREYNNIRIRRLLDILPKKQQPVFHALPFLLHTNIEGFPGYTPGSATPHGIERFAFNEIVVKSLTKLFPHNTAKIPQASDLGYPDRAVKSLLLMGSLGTMAQTHDSDLDYWVCIYKKNMKSEELTLFEDKLRKIEEWAENKHSLEVHY